MKIYKQNWKKDIRIKTLPLSIITTTTGSVLAKYTGKFQWTIAILATITSILLQTLANFSNDYGDYIKGCDTNKRIGPLRSLQNGLISSSYIKKIIKINTFATCLFGLILIIISLKKIEEFTIFLMFGIASIISAITYTIGKKPYGYLGLGDIFVLIFFGWLSIIGTYYLQTNNFDIIIFIPATSFGLMSVAVLNINNMRDIDNDTKSKKKTLVVRFGIKNAKIYHAIIIILSILCLIFFNLLLPQDYKKWIFLITTPMFIKHIYNIFNNNTPLSMKPMLSNIIKIILLTNILFLIGILISK